MSLGRFSLKGFFNRGLVEFGLFPGKPGRGSNSNGRLDKHNLGIVLLHATEINNNKSLK
jgi:hypothetical protein